MSVLVGNDVRFLSADFIFGDFRQEGGQFRALLLEQNSIQFQNSIKSNPNDSNGTFKQD